MSELRDRTRKALVIAKLVLVVVVAPIAFPRLYLMNVWRWVIPAFGSAWHDTKHRIGTWPEFKQMVADEWNGVLEEELRARERERLTRQFRSRDA